MKKFILLSNNIMQILFMVLIVSGIMASYSHSAISTTINSQGVLSQSNGSPLTNGTYSMKFSIWNCDDPAQMTCKLWEEDYSSTTSNPIAITDGYYNVYLGSVTPFPSTLTFSEPYYLGIKIQIGTSYGDWMTDDDGNLPAMTSVPSAFRSKTSSGRLITSTVTDPSGSYSFTNTDILLVSGTGSVTLPSADSYSPGRVISIKKTNDTGSITVNVSEGGNIDGDTTVTLDTSYGEMTVINDDSEWYRLGFVADSSITSAKIADNTISSADLADNAVTSANIADESISPTKLAGSPGAGVAGNSLISNGDGTFSWDGFVTTQPESSATFNYSLVGDSGSYPVDVDLDSDGNIYVAEYNKYRIRIYSDPETFQRSIGTGSPGTGSGEFNRTDGVAVDRDGKVYVVEHTNNRVQVFTAQGAFEYSIGKNGTGPGEFVNPQYVAVDSSGKIYVSDTNNNRVQVFTASGSFDYSIGSFGAGNGEFKFPMGIAVDNNGKIYVVDKDNKRVQVFLSGAFDSIIGSSSVFSSPYGIEVDNDGKIYVSDRGHDDIRVFSSSGSLEYTISNNFDDPTGIAVDSTKIYVADKLNNAIQIFDKPLKTYTVETGFVGIGTTNPSERLEVAGSVSITDRLCQPGATSNK